MNDLISDLIQNVLIGGKCPDCHGEDMDEFCITCQFCNGVSRKETFENGWTKEQVLEIAKKRKLN